jgi:hypothetical protein
MYMSKAHGLLYYSTLRLRVWHRTPHIYIGPLQPATWCITVQVRRVVKYDIGGKRQRKSAAASALYYACHVYYACNGGLGTVARGCREKIKANPSRSGFLQVIVKEKAITPSILHPCAVSRCELVGVKHVRVPYLPPLGPPTFDFSKGVDMSVNDCPPRFPPGGGRH